MRRDKIYLIAALLSAFILLLIFTYSKSPFNTHNAWELTPEELLYLKVEVGLDKYFKKNGIYPSQISAPPAHLGKTYFDIFMRSGSVPVLANAIADTDWDEIARNLVIQIRSVDSDVFWSSKSDESEILRDSQHRGKNAKVMRYRPAEYYPQSSNASLIIDMPQPPGSKKYQVWFTGKDGVDKFGEMDDGSYRPIK